MQAAILHAGEVIYQDDWKPPKVSPQRPALSEVVARGS